MILLVPTKATESIRSSRTRTAFPSFPVSPSRKPPLSPQEDHDSLSLSPATPAMITLDPFPPPASSAPSPGNDALVVWPPSSSRWQHAEPLSPKKPRLSYHPPPQPEKALPLSPAHPPPTSVYFKTRLCHKFMFSGTCPFGNSCTFAHGNDDLRYPPPNLPTTARPQRSSRAPGGGNASGFRRPLNSNGFGFGVKSHGSSESVNEERATLSHGSAELKKRQMSVDANMKNSRAAPRSTSSKSSNGSTPVEKSEPVISRKVFKNIAGIKKIIGIYGDWIE